jgi:hypothetical protein
VNQALEHAGFLERVDHRSLAAQGIERVPQIHLGPNVVRMEDRGLGTDRGDQAQRIEDRNRAIAEHRFAIREIDAASPAQEGLHGSLDSTRAPSQERDTEASDREALEAAEARSGVARTARGESPDAPDVPPSDAGVTRARSDERAPAEKESLTHDPGRTPPRESNLPRERDEVPRDRADKRSAEPHVRPPEPPIPIDRTARAVSRQLAAMGLERFDIGVRDAATAQLERRTWSRQEVLENLAWLKHRNARGAEIQVRPAAESPGPGLVLLDSSTASIAGRSAR